MKSIPAKGTFFSNSRQIKKGQNSNAPKKKKKNTLEMNRKIDVRCAA